MKKLIIFFAALSVSMTSLAADYVIDTKGAHAFIQFKVKHLGFSWLYGRFDRFEGSFTYDESAPEKASIKVDIDTTSVNSSSTTAGS